ncbi:hypothetical protein GC163_19385 [bacterium]|nr:hypothetical protein [bacterium]
MPVFHQLFDSARYRSWVSGVLLALGLVQITGCGGSSETIPELVTVTGTVLVNGQPLQGVSLNFVPQDQTKGTGAFGGTMADGSYELMHRSRAKGIEPGTYYVTFSRYAMPDGSPIPEGKNVTDVGARESFPPALVSPEPSRAKHVVTILADKPQTFDFDLEVKKK